MELHVSWAAYASDMEYVLINNRSALECWERGFVESAVPIANAAEIELAGDVASFRLAMKSLPCMGIPAEILVTHKGQRNHLGCCQPRVWGEPLPPNSVYALPGSNVAISAPWFCFMQMASRLPFPQAMLLGMELCGGYSTLPFARSAATSYIPTPDEKQNGFVKREPLLTPQGLMASLAAVLPPASEAKALVAARQIAANSHSPAESRHFIRLFATKRRGGYGLPRPMMNVHVPLPPNLAAIADRHEYICDFLYPKARVAIEYDGGYHWNGEQRLDDNLRELILDALEIEVVRIDKHQLESDAAAGICARAIAKRLGVRLREPGEAALARRGEMRRQLADYSFDLYA